MGGKGILFTSKPSLMSYPADRSYTVHAPRRMIQTRQQSVSSTVTITRDGRLVPRESLPQHTHAPTAFQPGQYTQEPTSFQPGQHVHGQVPAAYHPGQPFTSTTRSMTAPATFPSQYHQPAAYPQDDWQSRWGNLQPGMSVVRIQGNNIRAGRNMNLVSEGDGISTMDVERNELRAPNIYCAAKGTAVGMNFGLEGDRGNYVDAQNDFTMKSKLIGQAEQTHRRGPQVAPANGYGGYGPTAYQENRNGQTDFRDTSSKREKTGWKSWL